MINYPHFLELIYQAAHKLLHPIRRWLTPGSRVEGFFVPIEKFSKGMIFDCRMCGQCVLHTTGMTCQVFALGTLDPGEDYLVDINYELSGGNGTDAAPLQPLRLS